MYKLCINLSITANQQNIYQIRAFKRFRNGNIQFIKIIYANYICLLGNAFRINLHIPAWSCQDAKTVHIHTQIHKTSQQSNYLKDEIVIGWWNMLGVVASASARSCTLTMSETISLCGEWTMLIFPHILRHFELLVSKCAHDLNKIYICV